MKRVVADAAKAFDKARVVGMKFVKAGPGTGDAREVRTDAADEVGLVPSPRRRAAAKKGQARNRARKIARLALSVSDSKLKYRFGFIAHTAGIERDSAVPENWRTERVGGCVVRLHPETSFFGVEGAAVIGPVVGRDGASIAGVLDALVTAPRHRFASLLGDLVGRFAVIVVREDGARVFNDAFGSRTLFYSPRSPGMVASHSGLLAETIQASPDEAVLNFMRTRTFTSLKVAYLPGDLTIFSGIYGLAPNNSYLMEGRTERYWPLTPRRTSDRETFFGLLEQSIVDLARLGENRRFILGITGGADSRVICAGLVKHAKPFDGVTWVKAAGGYLPDHERPAVDQMVSMLGLRHHYINVGGALEESGVVASVNSGSIRGSSTLVSGMSAISEPGSVFVRGYGGEIVRGFYNIQREPMTTASPAEFGRMFQKRRRQIDPFVLDAFEMFWERANWHSVEQMGYDINDIFYWEHRMGMWGSTMLNYMDSGVESWVGINSRPLYEAAFGLRPEERLTRGLFAEAVARFHKPLADVPIYLHGGNVLVAPGAQLS